jgi:hypothetical protein
VGFLQHGQHRAGRGVDFGPDAIAGQTDDSVGWSAHSSGTGRSMLIEVSSPRDLVMSTGVPFMLTARKR